MFLIRSMCWYTGILGFSFGISERSISLFSDSFFSAEDLIQLFTASFFFVLWILLKPLE